MLPRSSVVCCLSFFLLIACGEPDREAREGDPFDYEEAAGGAGGDGTGHQCDEGDTKKCRIKIGDHEGVVTCVDGERTCVDGDWSDCEAIED